MHPVAAYISPALRTALAAWLVCRLGHAAVRATLGHAVLELPAAPSSPLWAIIARSLELLGRRAPLSWWIVVEACFFFGLWGVYTTCRRGAVPQTAERAVWLWALCPIAAIVGPGSSWALAIGLALGAVGLGAIGRAGWGAAALFAATMARPEAALVAAGGTWITWRARQPGALFAPLAFGLAAPSALAATVFGAMAMAGADGVSVRTLRESAWRLDWGELSGALPWIALALAACVAAIGLARRAPRAWIALAIPIAAWPLSHADAWEAAPVLLMSAGLFGYASLIAERPGIERAWMAACGLGWALALSAA